MKAIQVRAGAIRTYNNKYKFYVKFSPAERTQIIHSVIVKIVMMTVSWILSLSGYHSLVLKVLKKTRLLHLNENFVHSNLMSEKRAVPHRLTGKTRKSWRFKCSFHL